MESKSPKVQLRRAQTFVFTAFRKKKKENRISGSLDDLHRRHGGGTSHFEEQITKFRPVVDELKNTMLKRRMSVTAKPVAADEDKEKPTLRKNKETRNYSHSRVTVAVTSTSKMSLRSKTEVYEAFSLEQRRLPRYESKVHQVNWRRNAYSVPNDFRIRNKESYNLEDKCGYLLEVEDLQNPESKISEIEDAFDQNMEESEKICSTCGLNTLQEDESDTESTETTSVHSFSPMVCAGQNCPECIPKKKVEDYVKLWESREGKTSVEVPIPEKRLSRVHGKSLDSILDTINEEEVTVQLRPKRFSLGSIYETRDKRKGVVEPRPTPRPRPISTLETIKEHRLPDEIYGRIWDCNSLNIKHGDILRTSVLFEETVEEIEEPLKIPIRYRLDMPNGTIYWLNELLTSYMEEEDPEMENLNKNVIESQHRANQKNRQTLDHTKILDGPQGDRGKSKKKPSDNSNTTSEKSPKGLEQHGEKEVKKKQGMLMKFFRKRMSQEDLERKGIYKNEPIFGNSLELLYKTHKTPVPRFVTEVIKLIEDPKNITSQGIYRASGNIATIQKIRLKVDSNKDHVLEEYKYDADVLAGSLKMFFRELKTPLIGNREYEKLVEISNSKKDPFPLVEEVIIGMPLAHRETLKAVLEHLIKVIEHESENNMSIQNMSICWGPSMIFGEDNTDLLRESLKKNRVVELLLQTWQSTFVSNLKSSDSTMSDFVSESDLNLYQSVSESLVDLNQRYLENEHELLHAIKTRLTTDKIDKTLYHKAIENKIVDKIVEKALKPTRSKTLCKYIKKADYNELGMAFFKYIKRKDLRLVSEELLQDIIVNGEESKDRFKEELNRADNLTKETFEHFRNILKYQDFISLTNNISKLWITAFTKNPTPEKVQAVQTILDFLIEKETDKEKEKPFSKTVKMSFKRQSTYDNVSRENSIYLPSDGKTNFKSSSSTNNLHGKLTKQQSLGDFLFFINDNVESSSHRNDSHKLKFTVPKNTSDDNV